jgi:hypothetical protein
MDAKHALSTDAAALIRRLDPDAIRERLDALDRERQALLVLLRAAMRARSDRSGPPQEDRHAD